MNTKLLVTASAAIIIVCGLASTVARAQETSFMDTFATSPSTNWTAASGMPPLSLFSVNSGYLQAGVSSTDPLGMEGMNYAVSLGNQWDATAVFSTRLFTRSNNIPTFEFITVTTADGQQGPAIGYYRNNAVGPQWIVFDTFSNSWEYLGANISSTPANYTLTITNDGSFVDYLVNGSLLYQYGATGLAAGNGLSIEAQSFQAPVSPALLWTDIGAAATPEPSALAIIATGMCTLVALQRRKRH
jgi:hypothetical protein